MAPHGIGDLTSIFNFSNPNDGFPQLPPTMFPPDKNRHPDVIPVVPSTQSLPKQESGVRPARALPYEFFVRGGVGGQGNAFRLHMTNTGRVGVNFQVYSGNATDLPRSYTVEAGKDLSDELMLAPGGSYDFSVFGPNGYLRRFVGKVNSTGGQQTAFQIADGYDVANGNLQLRLTNPGKERSVFTLASAYNSPISGETSVRGGDVSVLMIDLRNSFGWYDLTVTVNSDSNALWRLAGHVETGRDSVSDPALGG